MNALHLSKSAEHHTPLDIIESARTVMGGIDLDPASSIEFNERVKATKFYTKDDDGLTKDWKGRVFLNPPGDKSGMLVKKFWRKLVRDYEEGRVDEAIWIGFSLEQLTSLQSVDVMHPLRYPTCVPRRRLKYCGDSPTHGSYITYLPDVTRNAYGYSVDLFMDEFHKYGIVTFP